jgi:hypothetical protein
MTARTPFPVELEDLALLIGEELPAVERLVEALGDDFYDLRVFVELTRRLLPSVHRLLAAVAELPDELSDAVLSHAENWQAPKSWPPA